MRLTFSLQELEAMPTLCVGQADNLRVDHGAIRIWLSRCGVADGEPYENKVTVEMYSTRRGAWFTSLTYQAQ